MRKLQVTQFPRQPENATVFQACLMPPASCASSGISCQLALGSPASSVKAGRTWVQPATPSSSLPSSLPPSQPASLPSSLHSLLPSSLSPSLSLFIPVAHRVEGYYNFLPTNYVCYKQKKACQTSLIIYILNQYHYPSAYSQVRLSVCLFISIKAQLSEIIIARATKFGFHIYKYCTQIKLI